MPAALSSTTKLVKQLSSSKLRTTAKIPKNVDGLANKSEEDEGETSKIEPLDYYGSDPFTFEELKKHWDDFTTQKKSDGKDSEHMVMQQEIYLKNDTTIVIKLTNAVKIDILERFRSDLATYLKTKLNNGKIVLETELLKEEATRMLYTNNEKFIYLAEKKPILKKLRDRLGLDPDF